MRRASFILVLTTLSLAWTLVAGCKTTAQERLQSPKMSTIDMLAWETKHRVPALDAPYAPTLFILVDLEGTIEPCGCTEDVIYGGISRIVGTLRAWQDAATYPFLTINTGNTLFAFSSLQAAPTKQDHARAALLHEALHHSRVQVQGVGPLDLAGGLEFFEETASKRTTSLVSTNVTPADSARNLWAPFHVAALGEMTVAFLNVIHPSAFESGSDEEALAVEDIHESLTETLHYPEVKNADLRILFAHGDVDLIADAIQEITSLDFVIFGSDEDAEDRVRAWDHSRALSLWSQGRAVGVLRLSRAASSTDGPWENARGLSQNEQKEYRSLLAYLDEQIEALDARTEPGETPPRMRNTLAQRRAHYLEKLEAAENAPPPAFESDKNQFLWDSIRITPNLPVHADTENARLRYNHALQQINLQDALPPPPPAPGQASYVGAAQCIACHQDAGAFWKSTPHATAYATLQERDKAYDLACVGCHVTGYHAPGGSAVGYTDGLQNVQCESCHGPGSLHAHAPVLAGRPQHIERDADATRCLSCHTSAHSTRFDYPTYRARILGAGHGDVP